MSSPDDYFTRHPLRIASSWPTTEIALLNSESEFDGSPRPAPTTHAPENSDHDQGEAE
jgi:type IV pilus biogenesis protein CpaD/CtpE